MARYTTDHKQQIHDQILAAARALMARGGIAEIGIPRVMGQAGLTHGGFYAHFASKDALVAEVCSLALGKTADRVTRLAASAESPAVALRTYLGQYLNPSHRDEQGSGCVLPSLSGEIARQDAPVRRAYTAAFERYWHAIAAM